MNYRKWLIGISLIILATIISIIVFIPKTIRLHQTTFIRVNQRAFFRTITDKTKWVEWWPGKQFTLLNQREYSTTVSMKNGNDTLLTEMTYVPWSTDSVLISWEGTSNASTGIWSKLENYNRISNYRTDMKLALVKLDSFYASEENIYSMKINKQHVVDSTLIATSQIAYSYPGIPLLDLMIRRLKEYAVVHQTSVTGFPMLNIMTKDSVHYLVRVALPVGNKLKDSANIMYRAMLGGGNILITEVHGGQYSINKAFTEMENYISDHKRIAPAIPFQSLVTDRSLVEDTSKWITKVFFPVM